LLVINERRLYRLSGYGSFAQYADRRWGMSRAYAYRKIGAARVVDMLREAKVEHLPANEAQARELAPLADDREAVRDAWLAAVSG
jgi:hypothetical protein